MFFKSCDLFINLHAYKDSVHIAIYIFEKKFKIIDKEIYSFLRTLYICDNKSKVQIA